MSDHSRNLKLDGLRGVAAASVVFYHAILHADTTLVSRVLYTPIQDLASTRDIISKLALMIFNGEAAVMIFFVLSGLVLHLSLQRQTAGSIAATSLKFALNRLFRILPAVIACMVSIYVVSKIYASLDLTSFFPQITLDQLWRNACLCEITIHGPSGSVQTEIAAIPILLVCFFVCRRFGPLALLICFIFTITQVQNPVLLFRYANMWPSACAFVGGMLLALPEVKSFFSRAGATPIFANILFFLICKNVVIGQTVTAIVAQTISCVILVGSVAYAPLPSFALLLQSKTAQFIGRVSYSLYLFNVLALMLLWSIPALSSLSDNPVVTGMFVGTLALLITLPLAHVSERWIERPGIVLGRKVISLGSSPSASAIPSASSD